MKICWVANHLNFVVLLQFCLVSYDLTFRFASSIVTVPREMRSRLARRFAFVRSELQSPGTLALASNNNNKKKKKKKKKKRKKKKYFCTSILLARCQSVNPSITSQSTNIDDFVYCCLLVGKVREYNRVLSLSLSLSHCSVALYVGWLVVYIFIISYAVVFRSAAHQLSPR